MTTATLPKQAVVFLSMPSDRVLNLHFAHCHCEQKMHFGSICAAFATETWEWHAAQMDTNAFEWTQKWSGMSKAPRSKPFSVYPNKKLWALCCTMSSMASVRDVHFVKKKWLFFHCDAKQCGSVQGFKMGMAVAVILKVICCISCHWIVM